jgi:YVTN family beta-propeller protein
MAKKYIVFAVDRVFRVRLWRYEMKLFEPATQTLRTESNQSTHRKALYGAIVLCALLGCAILNAQTTASPPITGGNSPWSLVVNPATNKVYVIDKNAKNATLLVIDGATNRVINSLLPLPIGGSANSIAVNPVTNLVYVVNNGNNAVTVVDGSTDTVVGTVSGVPSGGAAVVNPLTNKIYVANTSGSSISVIDGTTCTATVKSCTVTSIGGLGSAPVALGLNPVTNKLYVANNTGNSVSVINASTNTLITTLANIGSRPVAIQVNPVTNKVYVVNQGATSSTGNNVTVIDGSTDVALTPQISVGNSPQQVGINPVTNMIYVANTGGTTVTAINGTTGATTPISVGINPSSVSVNMLTNMIYTSSADPNNQSYVWIINGSTNTASKILIGNCPNGAAVNPVTNKTYVANTGANCTGNANISIVDGTTNVLGTTSATVGAGTSGVVLNPLTNMVYAANASTGVVTLNGANLGTAPVTVGLPSGAFAAAVNPVTNTIYAVDNNASLQVINAGTNTLTATVSVGSRPQGVAVNATTNIVYATNSSSNTMSVVDGSANTVTTTVPVGNNPIAVAANPTTNRIYVANYNDGTVSIIDGATNTAVTAPVTVGGHPHDIQINPVTNFIYVANQNGGATGISVINGATNAVTQLASPSGAVPWAVAVDTSTNEIYVLNHQTAGSVTVVLGATSTTAAKLATTLPSGTTFTGGTIPLGSNTTPNAIAINTTTQRIYIASGGTSGMIYIDGASGSVTNGPAGISGMLYLAVNPVTNRLYVANSTGTQLYVIGADGAVGSLPSPLTTTITGSTSDPLVLSPGSATTAYQTANPAPTINVVVASAFSSLSAYSSLTVTNPPPTTVYYTVDGGAPTNVALPTQLNGASSTFTFSLVKQQLGTHTLYVFPAYGNEAGSANSGSGTARGNLPEIGNMAAYTFAIAAIPTTTTVVADINPQLPGQSITFTATVTPQVIGTDGPTGTVLFYDISNPASPILLGSGTLAQLPGSYQAVLATTALTTAGDHPILAMYNGDASYKSSFGTVTETINASLGRLVVVGGGSQTIAYGGNYSTLLPFIVQTTDSGGTPISTPTAITFSVPPGATLSAPGCTTSSSQCSVHALNFSGAGSYTFTASATNSASAVFTVIVTKVQLTVAATTLARAYGMMNPGLAYTVTGFVNGDSASNLTGVPELTTAASLLSPVGSYPIDLSEGTLSSTNYTFNLVSGSLNITQAMPASGAATVLTIDQASVMYGDTAVLTAVVSPFGATGTMTFTATPSGGGTAIVLGTASVDSAGESVLPESTLNAGTYNIVANYNGDPNIAANVSNTVSLTVTQRTGPGPNGAALIISVNDASRTTTQSNPPFSYGVSGVLVNNDTYAMAIAGTPVYSTAADTTPGTFAITVAGLTSANYVIAFLPGTLTVAITPTTTTVTPSPGSPQYGDTVTLTATVAPSGVTGTVSFYDGSVYLGNSNVSGGVATLATATLNAGAHTIMGIYGGDASYASSSATTTLTVAKKTGPGPNGAALVATVQSYERTFGTADPQFNYVVTGTLVNGDTYPDALTGVPIYTVTDTSNSPVGSTFPINMSGLVSQNYVIAIVPGTLAITQAATTTTLSTNTPTTEYGQPFTLTANTAPSNATGTVIFSTGSTVLGTATLSTGQATFTTSSLNAGTYVITATYGGDSNFGASTSSPVTIIVTKATGPGPGNAALTITVANASRNFGQGNPAFTYSVSGTLVNGDTYQTAVTGVPVYATTATVTSVAGSYPISLTGGLNSNNYVIAFVNGTLTIGKGTPVVTVTSSLNPSTYTASVTFTATVSAGATGTVTFMDGSTVLGTATITGSPVTFTTSTLLAATHPITAVYSGDSNYSTATSAVLSQVVNKATPGTGGVPAITVTSSLNPSIVGQSVTFTATVPSGATGTVKFMDGSTLLGTGTITGTTATFTTTTLVIGTHQITAVYSGDSNYNTASSAVLSQIVTAASDFAVAATPPTQIIPPGASATYNVSITSVIAPFTNQVTLTATGLPAGATYTYTPPAVAPGAAGATSSLKISVPMQSARSKPNIESRAPLILAVLLLPLLTVRRRGASGKLLLILASLAAFGAMTGCGVGGYFSQPQQTYTITVTGTSGNLVHSATVTLTVE